MSSWNCPHCYTAGRVEEDAEGDFRCSNCNSAWASTSMTHNGETRVVPDFSEEEDARLYEWGMQE